MSTRESSIQSPNSINIAGEHNGFDAVANLVASLLDDITIAANGTASTHLNDIQPNGSQPSNSYGVVESKVFPKEIPVATATESPAAQFTPSSVGWLPVTVPATVQPSATPTITSPAALETDPPSETSLPDIKLPVSDSVTPFLNGHSAWEGMSPIEPAHPLGLESIPAKSTSSSTPPLEPLILGESTAPLIVEPVIPGQFYNDGLAINIKGRADGVSIEIGKGNWEILVDALHQRLTHSGTFFRGGNVALDLADRTLTEPDLRAVCDVLVTHGMKPALVRTSSDRTFQSALMIGMASTLETKEGHAVETIQAANSNQEAIQHYVYRGALRSGQVLKRRSHVLIIGDVNPGSEVIATGDILVWGRLRGAAHAGAEGDVRAVVAAFDIDPVQLRIADAVALGSGAQSENGYRWFWSRNSEKRPEIARLVNGQIIVEPWDEAKNAGSPVLKRRR